MTTPAARRERRSIWRGFSGRRVERAGALLLGAGLIALFVLSQRAHPPSLAEVERGGSEPVRVARVERLAVPERVSVVGTVTSRRRTEVSSRLLAEIRRIHEPPGARVSEGDVLVTLDDRDVRARLGQAEATLRSLREQEAEARTELERTRRLFAKDATTRRALDTAGYRLAEVTARREAAEKARDEARIRLDHATITAPFDAVVEEKHMDPGDLAVPGAPILDIHDPRALRLEVAAGERLIRGLETGDEIEVFVGAPGLALVGVVSEVVPAIDPRTRTGTVRIDLPPGDELRPGMFARASIPIGEREVLAAPLAALVRRGQLDMVFVIGDPAPGGAPRAAELRLVRPGRRLDDRGGDARIELLAGVDGGEWLVVTGAERLRDGAPVLPERGDDKARLPPGTPPLCGDGSEP